MNVVVKIRIMKMGNVLVNVVYNTQLLMNKKRNALINVVKDRVMFKKVHVHKIVIVVFNSYMLHLQD